MDQANRGRHLPLPELRVDAEVDCVAGVVVDRKDTFEADARGDHGGDVVGLVHATVRPRQELERFGVESIGGNAPGLGQAQPLHHRRSKIACREEQHREVSPLHGRRRRRPCRELALCFRGSLRLGHARQALEWSRVTAIVLEDFTEHGRVAAHGFALGAGQLLYGDQLRLVRNEALHERFEPFLRPFPRMRRQVRAADGEHRCVRPGDGMPRPERRFVLCERRQAEREQCGDQDDAHDVDPWERCWERSDRRLARHLPDGRAPFGTLTPMAVVLHQQRACSTIMDMYEEIRSV